MTDSPAPRHFSSVDPNELSPDAFHPIEKRGGLCVARLITPLLVQTPPMVLASSLTDETTPSRVHLEPTRGFEAFAHEIEDRVLNAVMANNEAWWPKPRKEQALRASLKRFCIPGESLQVRVPPNVELFDVDGNPVERDHEQVQLGRPLRFILCLSEVCFGKNEFGALWTLVQARACPPKKKPQCLIDPNADDPDDITAPIENEFF
jgi:hypothetical protein